MSLKRNEINPLSVLGLRKLTFIPEHFSVLEISYKIDTKLLDQWIQFNLNSRYALQNGYSLDENKKITNVIKIGIEDPKELTMLSLGCNLLHKKD